MRLSKFLSLSIAMSRNQAKFFIKKGRVSVDSCVVTDPNFELEEETRVIFDGKPIGILNYQYFLLHKPASYVCVAKHSQYVSVLSLIKAINQNRYYYFANELGPELTGLVLLSDDARWTNRMKRKLLKKPCVYHARTQERYSEGQFERLRNAWLGMSDSQNESIIDVEKLDERTLMIRTNYPLVQKIKEIFSRLDLPLATLHLQQLGRLSLDDLAEGDYLKLTENEVKV